MRKIMLSVVTGCALLAFVPASALAHRHHKRHHRAHHAQVHHKTFGHDWSQSGSMTPTMSSDQNAGTVQSFLGGVLTIELADHSTVSGKVTDATEIECRAPETSNMQSHHRGDDNRGGGDNGDNNRGDDNDNENQNENENEHANCDSSSLTPGTMVHEASLKISSAGAVWEKVELVTAPAADNDNDND